VCVCACAYKCKCVLAYVHVYVCVCWYVCWYAFVGMFTCGRASVHVSQVARSYSNKGSRLVDVVRLCIIFDNGRYLLQAQVCRVHAYTTHIPLCIHKKCHTNVNISILLPSFALTMYVGFLLRFMLRCASRTSHDPFICKMTFSSVTCIIHSVRDIAVCLENISNDPHAQILRMKNRLSPDYNAVLSGGYRDVALNLLLATPETQRLGLSMHTHTHTHALVHTYTHTYTHTHARTHANTHTHTHTHTHTPPHTHARTHTHTHTYKRNYIHTYTNTHTCTDTQSTLCV